MTTHHSIVGALCVASFLLATPALASDGTGADWPHWRGPDSNGASVETGWSAEGRTRPLWSKNIGFGHSSFAVSEGRLFAMGYDEDRKLDVVHCLDPETGRELWTHTYPAEFWNEGHDGGTCTTPTVDGNVVFTSNREGRIYALRADTGSVIWSHEMVDELGVTPPRWGFSGSPVVSEDLVVANVSRLAAFDKETGELAWISETDRGNAYSTPIEYDFNGRRSFLVLNGLGLSVIDRADGSEITFYPWTRNPERAVYGATPVIVDGKIFISAASGGGCAMLEPNADDGLDVVWESRAMRSNYAGCVLYDGHLYGFDASMLKCIDLEGKTMWRERGIGLGAMVVVGDRLLIISAKGEIIIAQATPEKYVELSREKVLSDGAYWATPVLSHGLVYVRNSLGDMVCGDYRSTGADTTIARDVAGALPAAETLLERHVQAIGGAAALEALESLHLTGKGESHGMGPIQHCDAELTWTAEGAFVWRFSSGLDFGYTPALGWRQSQGGTSTLEPDEIASMSEVGNLKRVLVPNWGLAKLTTTDSRVFDDRLCYVVEAETETGEQRTLYFEVESGFLAGQEAPEKPLWVYDEYRAAGDAKVPTEWSFFVADSGSMTHARFEDVTVNSMDDDWLQPPLLIQMMTRSPEEKEKENERLRALHGDLVGNYALATGSMIGTPIGIDIEEGGIRLAFGPGPPDYLSEPDEEHRMYLMSNREIYLTVVPGEDGGDPVMTVWAYGDEFGRIERKND